MASTQTNDEAKAKHHDTRQLLDELDALMDQMLALPINDQYDNETSSPAPATVSATLTLLDPPASAAPEASPAPHEIQRQPAAEENFDDRSREKAAGNYETSSEPSAANAEPIPVPVLSDVAAPAKVELAALPALVASASWRPDHVSYQFMLWINQRYDGGTRWLGQPGKLLRSRAGKALLGFVGLGLLGLAAISLAKDWLGWN